MVYVPPVPGAVSPDNATAVCVYDRARASPTGAIATRSIRPTTRREERRAIESPTAPSPAYSDAAGTPDRRRVFLSRYDGDDDPADGDPFTGVDAGLLWIRVEIEGTNLSLERLRDEGE